MADDLFCDSIENINSLKSRFGYVKEFAVLRDRKGCWRNTFDGSPRRNWAGPY